MTEHELNGFYNELEKMAFLGFGGGGDKYSKPDPAMAGSEKSALSFITDPIKKHTPDNVKKTFSAVKKTGGRLLGPGFALWEGMSARNEVLKGSGLYEGMSSAKDLARNMRR